MEAIEWGKRGYRESPGLAIGLELGRAYLAAGNEKEAAFTLQFASLYPPLRATTGSLPRR